MVTLILLIFTAVLATVGLLLGRARGFARQIVRMISVIASAALAFVITGMVEGAISDWVVGLDMQSVINAIDDAVALDGGFIKPLLLNLDPIVIGYILSLPMALLLLPLSFVLIFTLIKLLMLIPHKIVSGLLGFSRGRIRYLFCLR